MSTIATTQRTVARCTEQDPVTGDLTTQRIAAQREYGRALRSTEQTCKCGAPATHGDRSAHSDHRATCEPCALVLSMLRGITRAAYSVEVAA